MMNWQVIRSLMLLYLRVSYLLILVTIKRHENPSSENNEIHQMTASANVGSQGRKKPGFHNPSPTPP